MSNTILNHGAVGDAKTDCTHAIQSAIDAAAANGGGTVIVPAGHFVSGTLWMKSNITLHLEPGATLLGSENFDAYPIVASKWEGPASTTRAALIAGEGLHNVAITGRGTIDGRGAVWWKQQRSIDNNAWIMRPRLIRLIDCKRVLIEGITVTNSPSWTVNPVACDDVTITKLTVINPADSPNTDGINPDSCRNVHISDCHIDVGDDCVTIKSGSEEEPRINYRPCENITVTNCTMIHGHGGVVIGSEMSGGIRNVAISNCTFVGTDRGIRIKARRGRGNGRSAAVEDIRVSNIVMDDVTCPIAINLFYGCGAWGESKVTDKNPQPVTEHTPRFRRLRFSNITARRVKFSAAFVLGLPEMWVDDIAFSDIAIYLDRANTIAGESDMAPDIDKLCRAGFTLKNVSRARLNNVQVFDHSGPAVSITNAREVSLKDVASFDGESFEAAIELRDVDGAHVSGCASDSSTASQLQIAGQRSRRIRLETHRSTSGSPAAVRFRDGADESAMDNAASLLEQV